MDLFGGLEEGVGDFGIVGLWITSGASVWVNGKFFFCSVEGHGNLPEINDNNRRIQS